MLEYLLLVFPGYWQYLIYPDVSLFQKQQALYHQVKSEMSLAYLLNKKTSFNTLFYYYYYPNLAAPILSSAIKFIVPFASSSSAGGASATTTHPNNWAEALFVVQSSLKLLVLNESKVATSAMIIDELKSLAMKLPICLPESVVAELSTSRLTICV